jgi:hypothetical protein
LLKKGATLHDDVLNENQGLFNFTWLCNPEVSGFVLIRVGKERQARGWAHPLNLIFWRINMNIRHFIMSVALLSSAAAMAQTTPPTSNTPRVDERQANQQQRIDQGVASGQLTAQEADRLNNAQARVDTYEAKAKSDGKVTRRERANLHVMQEKQDRRIKVQKRDKQKTS